MPPDQLVVSGYHGTITRFAIAADGALRPLGASAAGHAPSFLAWNAEASVVYAVDEADPAGGRVRAFARSPRDGALTAIGAASSGGGGPCHCCVHPGGHWLLAANYGSGHVAVLPILPGGGLGEPVDIQHPGEHAHMALVDPTGRFVLVPCLGSDLIAQYRFDDATGRLTPADPPSLATAAGSGPRFLIQVGSSVYAIGEHDCTITTYVLDAAKGTLGHGGAPLSLLPPGYRRGDRTGKAEDDTGAHVAASPDGRFVYASIRGPDLIAVFRRDAGGALTLLGHEGGGELKKPRHFAIDSGGTLLAVASQDAGLVTLFGIDDQDGTLKRVGAVTVDAGPAFVGFLPDPSQAP